MRIRVLISILIVVSIVREIVRGIVVIFGGLARAVEILLFNKIAFKPHKFNSKFKIWITLH